MAGADPLGVIRRLASLTVVLAGLVAPAPASADSPGLEIVAPQEAVATDTVRYEAKVAGSARRVAFFVDGERRWTDRAVGGLEREGYLRTTGLDDGPHSLTVTVRRRGGRVLRTRHVLFVARTAKGRKKKEEPAPAPAPAPEEPAPEEPAAPAPEEPAPLPAPEEPVPAPEPEEPAPAPEPEPLPDLFNGATIGSFALLQAAPGAIREVADPLGSGSSIFSFTVKESDVYPITPTENPRAQALSPSFIDPGEEFWLRTKLMLPTDFPQVDGWMCLSQVYGPPFGGPSPWQIGIRGNKLMWQRNGTYKYDIAWEMPLPRGRWVDVLVHQRFASDGWVEMWVDGERVTFFQNSSYNPSGVAPTQRLAMATRDASNNGGPNHAKIMQYRQKGLFDVATVYFGALEVGTSRTAVGA